METLNNPVEDCGEGAKGENSEEEDGPPADDCCPICFGDFTIPCKANCGHWYCGSCILQFWNYSSASKPCKCPMCSRFIRRLTPEASLCHRQEQEVTEVLKNILRYNRLFVGGARGLLQKVLELPLLMKRIFLEMMDPDREDYLHEMRLFAMFLSILYAATPFNFIPTGSLGIVRVFDYSAIALVVILRLIGIYRRRRLNQRVRRLAAVQPEPVNE
ncbi:E3 ubiquitin-protein ligase RNF170 isoform X1 [Mangifera indica]|uniref:E3 ubiquitin-protein ligase RNF170 isoform X1 n=1 Tax=Mangifera indica TaxID=29780 RepID=UPI001CFA744D|nr:E3 ubiquitin-protein ligase RNF170 isoform X1 [Mangifera indica]